ncbi:unannotated protein [freshwater metagenome]|uniref:Unannotated protein n=1 Tax=freshwater metagenome TaxID=449393 RepID=A0A6J7KTF7_9ZZZZ
MALSQSEPCDVSAIRVGVPNEATVPVSTTAREFTDPTTKQSPDGTHDTEFSSPEMSAWLDNPVPQLPSSSDAQPSCPLPVCPTAMQFESSMHEIAFIRALFVEVPIRTFGVPQVPLDFVTMTGRELPTIL